MAIGFWRLTAAYGIAGHTAELDGAKANLHTWAGIYVGGDWDPG